MIRNEQQFLSHIDAEIREDAKRNLYKYSDCGAWIAFAKGSIKVGSIVEGCDFGTTVYELKYPFASTHYDRCIEAIEAEASALWDWANESDQETDAPDIELDYPELEPYRVGRSA